MLSTKKNLMFSTLLLQIFCISSTISQPPIDMPYEFWSEFTSDGNISLEYLYKDDSSQENIFLTSEDYEPYIQKASNCDQLLMGETDKFLYEVLDSLKECIFNKNIAVISPALPFYESVVLSYGAQPTVITHKNVNSTESRVEYTTINKCELSSRKFDYVICISNLGSHGLGSFGEQINPNGDLEMMNFIHKILKDDGKLILSIPIGEEKILWNTTRIYGEKRLKMLFKNWRPLKYYGFTSEHLHFGVEYQPVFLLRKRK